MKSRSNDWPIRVLAVGPISALPYDLRAAIARQPDMRFQGLIESPAQAVEQAASLRPSIVLVISASMDRSELRAIYSLCEAYVGRENETKILVAMAFPDRNAGFAHAYALFASLQHTAYWTRKDDSKGLLGAIRSLHLFVAAMDREVNDWLLSVFYPEPARRPFYLLYRRPPSFCFPPPTRPLLDAMLAGLFPSGTLTPRETDVFVKLCWLDLSNREIASALGISERTVTNHLSTIYDKAGYRADAGLVGAAEAGRGQEPRDEEDAAKSEWRKRERLREEARSIALAYLDTQKAARPRD